jgi:hypothetical protein
VEWPVFINVLKEDLGIFEDDYFDLIKTYLGNIGRGRGREGEGEG